MPYIAIKSFPKDEETVKKVVEQINQIFLETWGCPPQAITISHETVLPENWAETVVEKEIEPKADQILIRSGEKQY